MNKRKLLREVGEVMYGERWQSPLARDLAVADRTVRRYLTDGYPLPPWLWPELQELLRNRNKENVELLAKIRAHIL